jgi:hypothetical protein
MHILVIVRFVCVLYLIKHSFAYLQGLNRIAAVALLYLNESDAFWLLVAVVEHLQPPDYYSQTLAGALADQKVLLYYKSNLYIYLFINRYYKIW